MVQSAIKNNWSRTDVTNLANWLDDTIVGISGGPLYIAGIGNVGQVVVKDCCVKIFLINRTIALSWVKYPRRTRIELSKED